MRIRTQFIITMLLFGVVLAAISVSALFTNRQVNKAREEGAIADSIAQGANELSYLANDYVIYREDQQLERWQTRFDSFSRDVASLDVATPEQQALVDNIQANTQRLKDVFGSVVATLGNVVPDQPSAIDFSLLQVSWSRLAVQNQALVFEASSLSGLLDNQVDRFQGINNTINVALVCIFIGYFVVNFLATQRRVLGSVAHLQAGAAVIGGGNLDFKVDEKKNDEIGDLARAFNRMTDNLKDVTATKTELENEMNERKKAEAAVHLERDKLTGVLNSMQDAVAIMNPDFGLEYINPSMQSQYGPISGRKCYQYFNARDDVCPWCNNKEVFAGQVTRKDVQSNKTGKTYEVTGTPLKNADGTVSKLAVWHDITERKRVEELKDDFIGMVSHELRTPLTVFLGAVKVVMNENLSAEEVKELLRDADKSAESMAHLVDNLLELSRYQANRIVISKDLVDVASMVRDLVRKRERNDSSHRFSSAIAPGLPLLEVDRARLELVLRNLMDNATKYSPDGTEIIISLKREANGLLFGVTDHGKGISSQDQAKLFQSFERLAETSTSNPGMGLGLHVCRRLIEAHGGRIWVDSEEGKGSTFWFKLPLHQKAG